MQIHQELPSSLFLCLSHWNTSNSWFGFISLNKMNNIQFHHLSGTKNTKKKTLLLIDIYLFFHSLSIHYIKWNLHIIAIWIIETSFVVIFGMYLALFYIKMVWIIVSQKWWYKACDKSSSSSYTPILPFWLRPINCVV